MEMENQNEKEKLVNLEGGDDENKQEEAEGKKVETNIQKKVNKEEALKKDSDVKIVFMKKGSYTVHILIQEIKNIEVKDAEYNLK